MKSKYFKIEDVVEDFNVISTEFYRNLCDELGKVENERCPDCNIEFEIIFDEKTSQFIYKCIEKINYVNSL